MAPALRRGLGITLFVLGAERAVEACGDGPASMHMPCGPSVCHDSPIGDICEGQECGYHNVTEPKIRAPNYHVMGTTCAENDPNGKS